MCARIKYRRNLDERKTENARERWIAAMRRIYVEIVVAVACADEEDLETATTVVDIVKDARNVSHLFADMLLT